LYNIKKFIHYVPLRSQFLYITIFRTTYNLQILRDVQIVIVTHLVFISILLYYYVTVYTGYLENNDKFFAYEQNELNWEEKSSIFAIVNKILITKNCRKLIFNKFLLKYYQLHRKTARDKNCLCFFHKTLRIFSEFFINLKQMIFQTPLYNVYAFI